MAVMNRRSFVAALAVGVPLLLHPSVAGARRRSRALSFRHTHTGEALAIDYAVDDEYVPEALEALNRLLRDFRTGDRHPIDPHLFDLLHSIRERTGSTEPFHIISGYRSPATNTMLRQHSEGVASGSLHMKGQAIDIRLPGVPLRQLRGAALDVRGGGVGYYPASDFVHVDTGRVRQW